MEEVLRHWAMRSGGLAITAAVLATWAALITWSQNDPSLSVNTAEPARNLLGAGGAVVADFFLHTLGLSVIFFLIVPLALGVELVSDGTIAELRKKLAFGALAIVAIAGGASALPLASGWPLAAAGLGGILGDFVYGAVSGLLIPIVDGAAGAIAGVVFFAAGFWALSRALCLERMELLDVGIAHLLNPGAAPLRPFKRRNAPPAPPVTPVLGEANYREDSSSIPRRSAEIRIEPEAPTWSLDDPIYKFQTVSPDAAPMAAGPGPLAEPVPSSPSLPVSCASPTVLAPVEGEVDDDLPKMLRREKDKTRGQDGGAGVRLEPHLPEPAAWQQPAAPRTPSPVPPVRPQPRPSHQAAQPLRGTTAPTPAGYRRPSLNMLAEPKGSRPSADTSPAVLQGKARMLEDVLADFRIKGAIREVRPGPVITLFELEPARGTKSSRVIALADDVARSMSAVSARISVIPGRNAIGIELPNTRRETFGLRELIDCETFRASTAKLPLVLGKGIGGEPILADLARMPHLLIAGTTGSGKSVGVNAMILSLIYRLGPEQCRFLMIDPKMLELSAYNGIPHLISPVITDPQRAITALAWAVGEMEERYKRMAELGVRSIDAFNKRIGDAKRAGERLHRTVQTGFDPATGEAVFEDKALESEPLPHIVIVVDEFADLMAVAGKEIEGLVQRLAQMARAAGIHMIMATQRPSVDVVTGTIKANFPTRISYRVASRIDSRTILGEQGAEQLLGQGDMLYLPGTGDVERVHGPFVSDEEVEAVTHALRQAYPHAQYEDAIRFDDEGRAIAQGSDKSQGDLFNDAVRLVLEDGKASTSYLQRKLAIGYNRAADLIERMEADGIVSPADQAGRRDILVGG